MKPLALLAFLPVAFGAAAQQQPVLIPSRDVDIVYMMVQADARGARVVEERMRWAAGTGMLRVDPPTPGMWVVVDTRAKRMATVRDGERSVLEIDSTQAMPAPAPGAAFENSGTDTVAGTPCTEWQTRDATGTPTLVCITADGVLLRAIATGRVLVEALHLAYVPQDAAVFRIPEGYRRIDPPPGPRMR